MNINERIKKIKKRLTQIESEKYFLLQEFERLTGDKKKSPVIMPIKKVPADIPLTQEEKINLFISLFACRQDVYPKLWINKTKGTKGQ